MNDTQCLIKGTPPFIVCSTVYMYLFSVEAKV